MVDKFQDLQCSAELSRNENALKILQFMPWLETLSLWLGIVINSVFVFGFEEHGQAAMVCSTVPLRVVQRFLFGNPVVLFHFDLGFWGKPFHFGVPWLLLLLAVSHCLVSAARFAVLLFRRYAYHQIKIRSQDEAEEEESEVDSAEPENEEDEGPKKANTKGYFPIVSALATDSTIVFTTVLLVASLCGLLFQPFFWALSLLDLLRSPTVLLLMGAVKHNANKLGQGGLVLFLLAYGHAIIGYTFFGGGPGGNGGHQEGKCDNLFTCSMIYVLSGIKGNRSIFSPLLLSLALFLSILLVSWAVSRMQCRIWRSREQCGKTWEAGCGWDWTFRSTSLFPSSCSTLLAVSLLTDSGSFVTRKAKPRNSVRTHASFVVSTAIVWTSFGQADSTITLTRSITLETTSSSYKGSNCSPRKKIQNWNIKFAPRFATTLLSSCLRRLCVFKYVKMETMQQMQRPRWSCSKASTSA
mmetsp:Transcript_76857/g.207496  ORF Transcript_76857/g.207496 Transcript_76857/m.207496 type:complete len:468 (-) Transcript_76857:3041-4444(-)